MEEMALGGPSLGTLDRRRQACARGDYASCVLLGDLLVAGTVLHDPEYAGELYRWACALDYEQACERHRVGILPPRAPMPR